MGAGVATESQATPRNIDCSENVRTGLEADAIATALIDNLHCLQARRPQDATRNDWYMALAYTVRDRMMHRYISTLASAARLWAPPWPRQPHHSRATRAGCRLAALARRARAGSLASAARPPLSYALRLQPLENLRSR